ncbi:MAG: hypothetical protein PCFJNLEI_02085 [Verrucomicrobiae bacterium]|nr:hypothetical protein [Verrucomicrobiae bacterium]
MSEIPRIIDSHQHVFWLGRDDAGLIADMDAHRIAYAWLLTWEILPAEDNPAYQRSLNPEHKRADGTHPGIPLSDLIKARDRYPKRFVLGCCPHPAHPSAPLELEQAYRIHGARVCGEWKFRMLFDDPRSLQLFHKAGELKMPVVLHLDVPYRRNETGAITYDPAWYGGTVENLERALQACPATIFIGHAPGFWREISGDAGSDPAPYPAGKITTGGRLFRLFDTYRNLYADLSAGSGRTALKRDPKHAVEFLTRYHDRLLFGRDCFGQETHDFLKTLKLPKRVRENIYYRNAERLVAKP